MITSSYRPGAWFGVFGTATTLLLPESEKSRVVSLWARIDDGAGFDEVLDALLQTGLGALPGFVLVSAGDGPTKILARGPVLVSGTADGEEVRIDGRDALTWVERTLDDVVSLTLQTEDAADVDGADDHDETDGTGNNDDLGDLPIRAGLVRVSRVDQPALSQAPAPATSAEAQDDEARDVEVHDVEVDDVDAVEDVEDVVPPPGPAVVAMPDDEPEPSADAGPLDEPVDLPEPSDPPSSVEDDLLGVPPAPPRLDTGSLPETEPDPLQADLLQAGAAQAEAAQAQTREESDHDGHTRTHTTGEEFVRELPGIPGQPAAPRIVPPVARLLISNGESLEVDRVILIGRAPEARRFTSNEQPRLVKVPSPLHEISSTHVEVRPGSGADHGSAVVTDMGSTNGTVLDQPGLGAESLKPGIAVQLMPGATINLGDGVTIQVTRP